VLRGAIVGFGNVAAKAHMPGWTHRSDVAIVAVTDPLAERRAVAGSLVPGASWHATADALLDTPDLDFVDICTPPSSHGPLIRSALERGLHVLCEKPLVGSMAELRALEERAGREKRVLHTVHNWHHAPIVRRTRELVEEQAIGRVERVAWKTLREKPAPTQHEDRGNWRLDPAIAGGGVLSDHGWHVFYIVHSWIGQLPVAVSATLETRRHTQYAVEDTATVQVTFPSATADVHLTWAADQRANWAQITGTAGTLDLEDGVLVLRRDGRETRWSCSPPLSNGSVHPEWFDPVIERFLSAVRNERADPVNLLEVGVCIDIEASARQSSDRGGVFVPISGGAPGSGPSS
jgi:predicted dehydrogenase